MRLLENWYEMEEVKAVFSATCSTLFSRYRLNTYEWEIAIMCKTKIERFAWKLLAALLNFFLLSPVKFDFQEWQGQVVSQAHNHSHHTQGDWLPIAKTTRRKLGWKGRFSRLKLQHDWDDAPPQSPPVSHPGHHRGHGYHSPPEDALLQRNATAAAARSCPPIHDNQQGVQDTLLWCHSGKKPLLLIHDDVIKKCPQLFWTDVCSFVDIADVRIQINLAKA